MQRSAYSTFVFPLFLLATVATAQNDDRAERWRDNCEHGWNNDRTTALSRFAYARDLAAHRRVRVLTEAAERDEGVGGVFGGLRGAR